MAVFDTQEIVIAKVENCKQAIISLPCLSLASVAVGATDEIDAYRSSQQKTAEKIDESGDKIKYIPVNLKADISFEDFSGEINLLNQNKSVTGIIINKPFPFSRASEVFSLIDRDKDVEGAGADNIGKFFEDDISFSEVLEDDQGYVFFPPTVRSVLDVLQACGALAKIKGQRVTLVGFSSIIGKPLALLLAARLATVSITHLGTSQAQDLRYYVEAADVIISAVGIPGLIKADWIKPAAVVIDVGTSKEGSRLRGDVEFEAAKEKASFITPVPGGIGRLTSLNLYYNLILAAKRQRCG